MSRIEIGSADRRKSVKHSSGVISSNEEGGLVLNLANEEGGFVLDLSDTGSSPAKSTGENQVPGFSLSNNNPRTQEQPVKKFNMTKTSNDSTPSDRPSSGGFSLSLPGGSLGSANMIPVDGSPPQTGGFSISLPGGSSGGVNMIPIGDLSDNGNNMIIGSSPTDNEGSEGRLLEKVNEEGLVMFSKNYQIIVKGGHIDAIITRLTKTSTPEPEFVETFLMTYRNFINPLELMEKLFNRYDFDPPVPFEQLSPVQQKEFTKDLKIVRLRVANTIKMWVRTHFKDFATDRVALEQLYMHVGATFSFYDPTLGNSIVSAIESAQTEHEQRSNKELMFSEPPPESIYPKSGNFSDFDPLEVARQICLYEQELYSNINPAELLNQAWNKNKDDAPNVTKLIEFFNMFSRWVATSICRESNIKARARKLKKFVQIAVYLKNFNNYNACQAILGAFGGAAVHRLYMTWSKAQMKHHKLFEEFKEVQEILSADRAFYLLRQTLKSSNPPCIPYLGVYLTDLTFIEDGNPNYLSTECGSTDIINFEKMRMVSDAIKDILLYQQMPYNFDKVPQIFEFFAKGNLDVLEENECYRLSRDCEPKDVIEVFKRKEKKLSRKSSINSLKRSFSSRK
eukprot:TRINITY_DN3625_c0_g2_i1.p1 TRINITY_DN3625_c0_g2~~TRINITY_DN3625_c0_g2_i1.p1  ORF type:complete len:622 (-),score=134.95 TRINITY_DN3625_c0_g2_i1:53-1918(-)